MVSKMKWKCFIIYNTNIELNGIKQMKQIDFRSLKPFRVGRRTIKVNATGIKPLSLFSARSLLSLVETYRCLKFLEIRALTFTRCLTRRSHSIYRCQYWQRSLATRGQNPQIKWNGWYLLIQTYYSQNRSLYNHHI